MPLLTALPLPKWPQEKGCGRRCYSCWCCWPPACPPAGRHRQSPSRPLTRGQAWILTMTMTRCRCRCQARPSRAIMITKPSGLWRPRRTWRASWRGDRAANRCGHYNALGIAEPWLYTLKHATLLWQQDVAHRHGICAVHLAAYVRVNAIIYPPSQHTMPLGIRHAAQLRLSLAILVTHQHIRIALHPPNPA